MKRRFFLQGVGGAAVVAPFLSTFGTRMARAQTPAPVRNIIFLTHNGCNTNRWFPTIENGALTAADLSPTLSPLADVVDQILIPRGYASLNGYGRRQSVDPHNQAMGSKLTCALIEESGTNYATGMSVDHEMAKQLHDDGASPLLLSVGVRSTSIKEVVSFSAATTPYVAEVNPSLVYSQLTGLQTNADPGGGVPDPVTNGDYRVARGQSVIDLITDDLSRYRARNMAQPDKDRIDAWLELLRNTETTMMPGGGGGMATASCNADFAASIGVTPETVAAAGTGVSGNRSGAFVFVQTGSEAMNQSFTVGGDMMLNLIALSAICDTNRVMGMTYPGYVIFDWDDIHHQYDHHGLSHRDGTLDVDNQCVDGVMAMIQQIDEWYAGKYAKLVKLLKSIPEGDTNVLYNTATMWLPELSDGDAHNLNNLPIVIAGSAGGKLKQGMAVNVENPTKNIGQGGSENGCTASDNMSHGTGSSGGNVPINKLYCTLMNAYGMKTADGAEWTQWGQFDNDNKNGNAFTNPGQNDELLA